MEVGCAFIKHLGQNNDNSFCVEMAHLMEDEVFLAYSTYATVVILKMLLMAPMTAYFRITRGVSYYRSAFHICQMF